MKISEAVRKLCEIQAEYGDLDFCTVQEVGEFFGIGTSVMIDIIDYPLDEREDNWEKVVAVLNKSEFKNEKPVLRLIK